MSAQADETAVNHAPSDRSIKNGSLPMNNGSLPMHTQHHDLNHWGAAGHITPVYTGSNGDYPIPPAPYYPFSSNPYSTGEQQTWGFASYQNNTPHHTYGQQAPQTDQQIFPPQNAPQFGGPQGYNFFDYSNTWNPGNIITHTATDARGLKAEYYQPRSVYGIESYNQSGGDLSRGMATLSIGGSSAALQVGEGHITMGGFGPVIPAPPNAPMPQEPPKALSWADKVKQPPKPSDYKSKRGPIGGTGGGRGVPEPQPLLPQGLWNGPAPALPRPTGPRGDAWSNNSPIPNNHIQSTVRRPPLTNNLGSPPETNHIRHNQVYNTTNGKEEVEPDSDVLQQLKRETNPPEINMNLKGARFFVIKSYSEDDVHRSIKYGIWCSTEGGNKRLEAAWKERNKKGPIYLFYSVNASGHFCGIAEMMSSVDYSKQSSVWAQDKWKGLFKVRWIYVKDVPNASLRHIRLENNENKPVTNSRDTQEMLGEKGRMVLKVIHSFKHTTSLFDDFAHYEKRQQEEDNRKRHEAPPKGGKGERHE